MGVVAACNKRAAISVVVIAETNLYIFKQPKLNKMNHVQELTTFMNILDYQRGFALPIKIDEGERIDPAFIADYSFLPKANYIIQVVAERFGLSPDDVKGKRRSHKTMEARLICYYTIKKCLTNCSLRQVGIVLGGRDHSTVIHGVDRVNDLIATEPPFRRMIEKIMIDVTEELKYID